MLCQCDQPYPNQFQVNDLGKIWPFYLSISSKSCKCPFRKYHNCFWSVTLKVDVSSFVLIRSIVLFNFFHTTLSSTLNYSNIFTACHPPFNGILVISHRPNICFMHHFFFTSRFGISARNRMSMCAHCTVVVCFVSAHDIATGKISNKTFTWPSHIVLRLSCDRVCCWTGLKTWVIIFVRVLPCPTSNALPPFRRKISFSNIRNIFHPTTFSVEIR